MMKTVVSHSAEWSGAKRQRITNMEKLAPGFATESGQLTRADDKITLVLARDQRAFSEFCTEYCRANGQQAGSRLRRIVGERDLQGLHPDKVQIIELSDWHMSMPYQEGQRVEQALALAGFPSRPDPVLATAGRLQKPPFGKGSSSSPKTSHSSLIVVERHLCGSSCDGTSRVRIGRTKERKGMIDGDPLDVVTTQYLDGKALRVASSRLYFQEDEMAFDAVPARTKDITDFGRLTTAAKSLAVSMSEYGPTNEPSSEQLAVFINGYRNLLEWRRKVREQMTRAEGEIDVVEALLTQIL
jgi:hypothetical protein